MSNSNTYYEDAENIAVESEVARICACYSGPLSSQVEALARSVVRMAFALNREGKNIETEPLVIPYNNGGGQAGVRENPIYKQYEALSKQYNSALTQLSNLLGTCVSVSSNKFAEFFEADE